jgi:hypothetical protein
VKSESRKRSSCLTGLLVYLIGARAVVALYYFQVTPLIYDVASSTLWAIPLLGMLRLAECGLLIGVWWWKRWAVYLLGVSTVLGVFLNVAVGVSLLVALSATISVVILFVLVCQEWEAFE